jgi:hypothetical protein
MSDVRIKTWPWAVAGSVVLHITAVTSVYLVPGSAVSSVSAGLANAGAAPNDTTPIYLISDELPEDVAKRLEAERAAEAARTNAERQPPKKQPELAAAEEPKPLNPIPVQLGVVDGPKIKTDTWLKNDAPGEHGAIQSEVEQPRLDQNAKPMPQGDPGQGGNDGKNGEKPADAPAPTKPIEHAAATPLPPAAKAAAAPVKAEAPQPGSEGPERPKTDLPDGPSQKEIKAGNAGGEKPAIEQAATEPRANPAPSPAKPAVVGVAGVAPGGQVEPVKPITETPGAAGAPGDPTARKTVPADRDADASSMKRSAVFRNGKVEAGEGLDIRTVRPQFGLVTEALLRPRSPTLEIVFGRDGRARSVKVLKSSGYPAQVDEPVVTALYNWRAKGKLLDQLPARPDASVSLEITVILQ